MLRKASAVVVAFFLLAMLGAAPPPVAAASDTVAATGETTYELVPSAGAIHVTLDLTVANHTPNTVDASTCTGWSWDDYLEMYLPYTYDCSTTTHWYINSEPIAVERGARNIKATSSRGRVSTSTDSSGTSSYILVKLAFADLYNGGSIKLHVTYDLPGGKPRTGDTIRAGRAYANFCASGNGPDGGSVSVVLPAGFTAETWGDATTLSTSGGKTVYSSGKLAEPLKYGACFDAVNDSAYATNTITASDGRLVEIQSWPEDPDWLRLVSDDVAHSLPALESLTGVHLPQAKIVVREVSESQLGVDYVGDFDPAESIARVSEKVEAATVAHELSHSWFNPHLFAERWLDEGYATYAEKTANGSVPKPCPQADVYAGSGNPPSLADWKVLGPHTTAADRDAVAYQYNAACWIVTDVAATIGDARMTNVLRAASNHEIAYIGAGAPETIGSASLDWRHWLDLVDERGVFPANGDLDFAAHLLEDFRIPKDNTELDTRSIARSQYHVLAAQTKGWAMPFAVRSPMANWQFTQAEAAMGTVVSILRVRDAIGAIEPVMNIDLTKIKAAFENARDEVALTKVADLANEELAAAAHLSKAIAAVDASRGPIEALGLAGVDLVSAEKSGRAALDAATPAQADAAAASLEAWLAGASGSGTFRAGGIVVILLMIAAGVFVIIRRRRARRASPVAVAVASSEPEMGPVAPVGDNGFPIPPPATSVADPVATQARPAAFSEFDLVADQATSGPSEPAAVPEAPPSAGPTSVDLEPDWE